MFYNAGLHAQIGDRRRCGGQRQNQHMLMLLDRCSRQEVSAASETEYIFAPSDAGEVLGHGYRLFVAATVVVEIQAITAAAEPIVGGSQ